VLFVSKLVVYPEFTQFFAVNNPRQSCIAKIIIVLAISRFLEHISSGLRRIAYKGTAAKRMTTVRTLVMEIWKMVSELPCVPSIVTTVLGILTSVGYCGH
jgi:hypothetical protein